jgi:hypothetical protein
MHLRSGTPDYADELHEELDAGGDASDIAAAVIRPTLVRWLRWFAALELGAMFLAVHLLDWSWG